MKQFRNPPDIHAPVAAYTHQIAISGSERLLILSGQVGMRQDGSISEDPIEQIEIAFDNLIRNLRAADMDVEDIVKLTLYLVGDMGGDRRRAAISAALGDHKPCMTLVYVAGLAAPIYKVELDAWASKAE